MVNKSKYKRYGMRSLKYLIYLVVVLVVVVALFSLLSQKQFDFFNLFRPGTGWQIALFLFIMSIVYPFFGYVTKRVTLTKEFDEVRPKVVEVFERHNYKIECELDGNLSFTHKSPFIRFIRFNEDRIVLTPQDQSFKLEGARKDVYRIARTIEFMLYKEQSAEEQSTEKE